MYENRHDDDDGKWIAQLIFIFIFRLEFCIDINK